MDLPEVTLLPDLPPHEELSTFVTRARAGKVSPDMFGFDATRFHFGPDFAHVDLLAECHREQRRLPARYGNDAAREIVAALPALTLTPACEEEAAAAECWCDAVLAGDAQARAQLLDHASTVVRTTASRLEASRRDHLRAASTEPLVLARLRMNRIARPAVTSSEQFHVWLQGALLRAVTVSVEEFDHLVLARPSALTAFPALAAAEVERAALPDDPRTLETVRSLASAPSTFPTLTDLVAAAAALE